MALALLTAPAAASAAPTWLSPEKLVQTDGIISGTSVATDPRGDTIVAWVERDTKGTATTADDIRLAKATFRPAGGSFGAPESVSNNGSQAGTNVFEVKAGMDASGNAIAAFTFGNGTNTQVRYRQRPAGGGWGAITDLTPQTAGNNASSLYLAVGSAGTVGVTWNSYSELKAAGAVGSTTGPMGLATTLSDAAFYGIYRPTVAVDDGGNVVFAWERDLSDRYLVETRLKPAGQSYQASYETLSTNAANSYAEYPEVAVDPRGQATIVYGYRDSAPTAEQIRFHVRNFPSS